MQVWETMNRFCTVVQTSLWVSTAAGAAFIMFFLGGKKEPKKPQTADNTAPPFDRALIELHYYC